MFSLAPRSATAFVVALAVFSSGCTHPLEIKNLSQYRPTTITSMPRKISVGIVSNEVDVNMKGLVKDIGTELERYAGEVVLPYSRSSVKKVDLIADVRVTPEYRGSGANFLINFPGFLIWAPAWHGYNYHVTYKIDVGLFDGANNEKIEEFSLPIELHIRQADAGRTWTEISWLEVGVIALIGGLYCVNYDSDLTPLVAQASGHTIGEYVGSEIIARVNASGRFAFFIDALTNSARG